MRSNLIYLIFLTVCTGIGCDGGPSNKNLQTDTGDVKSLFTTHCAVCHGIDGRKGLAGAKILTTSQLDMEKRVAIISNGKGNMMPYRDVLNADQIKALAEYTLSLK